MADREFWMKVGERLREARKEKGLSQTDLAAALGIGPSMISHIEAGRKPLSVRRITAAAQALKISTDRLLGPHDAEVDLPPIARALPHEEGPDITADQTLADYQLILRELLPSGTQSSSLSADEVATIAAYIRHQVISRREEGQRRPHRRRDPLA